MKNVHQHPDGMIFVRVDEVTYQDTPENFSHDFGIEWPALPEGYDERLYYPGVRHTLAGKTDQGAHIQGGEMPWALGDEAIARVGEALAAQTKRAPPPPELKLPPK